MTDQEMKEYINSKQTEYCEEKIRECTEHIQIEIVRLAALSLQRHTQVGDSRTLKELEAENRIYRLAIETAIGAVCGIFNVEKPKG